MSTCARCGHELGVGRYCTNCGHPVGEPVPEGEALLRHHDGPLPDQPGRGRPGWLPIVLGAVLAVLLLVVLVSCLGGDDEPGRRGGAATDPPAAGPAEPADPGRREEPGRRRKPADVSATARIEAPQPAPATRDLDGSLVGYTAEQMVDDVPQTCFRVSGDGIGTTITFALRRPTTLTRVGLVNGYAKQVPDGATLVDWYPLNRRITAVEWVFDDGTTVGQDLREVPSMQGLRIDPVTTRTVRLRILGVTPPGAGPLGRDYTAISEVVLSGTRA